MLVVTIIIPMYSSSMGGGFLFKEHLRGQYKAGGRSASSVVRRSWNALEIGIFLGVFIGFIVFVVLLALALSDGGGGDGEDGNGGGSGGGASGLPLLPPVIGGGLVRSEDARVAFLVSLVFVPFELVDAGPNDEIFGEEFGLLSGLNHLSNSVEARVLLLEYGYMFRASPRFDTGRDLSVSVISEIERVVGAAFSVGAPSLSSSLFASEFSSASSSSSFFSSSSSSFSGAFSARAPSLATKRGESVMEILVYLSDEEIGRVVASLDDLEYVLTAHVEALVAGVFVVAQIVDNSHDVSPPSAGEVDVAPSVPFVASSGVGSAGGPLPRGFSKGDANLESDCLYYQGELGARAGGGGGGGRRLMHPSTSACPQNGYAAGVVDVRISPPASSSSSSSGGGGSETCTGFFVGESWVMLAGHCTLANQGTSVLAGGGVDVDVRVLYDCTDRRHDLSECKEVSGLRLIPHCSGDIALIELAHAVTVSRFTGRSPVFWVNGVNVVLPSASSSSGALPWGGDVGGGRGSSGEFVVAVGYGLSDSAQMHASHFTGVEAVSIGGEPLLFARSGGFTSLPCFGDSGGPLLFGNVVVGLFASIRVGGSGVDEGAGDAGSAAYCDSGDYMDMYWVRTDHYGWWVVETIASGVRADCRRRGPAAAAGGGGV